jgi:hypothetical protein
MAAEAIKQLMSRYEQQHLPNAGSNNNNNEDDNDYAREEEYTNGILEIVLNDQLQDLENSLAVRSTEKRANDDKTERDDTIDEEEEEEECTNGLLELVADDSRLDIQDRSAILSTAKCKNRATTEKNDTTDDESVVGQLLARITQLEQQLASTSKLHQQFYQRK